MRNVATPFSLYSDSAGLDFDQGVLDGFDDIKAKVADELKLQSVEVFTRREIPTWVVIQNHPGFASM